jgi:regulator of ribonuclease activity A
MHTVAMKWIPTADLCDAHEALFSKGLLFVVPPVFQNYGGGDRMMGEVFTLRCFEDNGLLIKVLEQPGQGRVLMVDAGGSDRCALVGGNLGSMAEKNGWSGLVLNGCVRDVQELSELSIPVWAMASNPRRGTKQGAGEQQQPVDIAGVLVFPGNWCYADDDGVIVARQSLYKA